MHTLEDIISKTILCIVTNDDDALFAQDQLSVDAQHAVLMQVGDCDLLLSTVRTQHS